MTHGNGPQSAPKEMFDKVEQSDVTSSLGGPTAPHKNEIIHEQPLQRRAD
jgi:hypothetical protein